MYDYHIHSEHSIDSIASMESMVLSAIDKNLKSICFTDHVDFDSTNLKIDIGFREADYFRNIKQVKYKYAGKIEVLAGVEIGMQPHLVNRYNNLISNNPFDFVILSIHSVNRTDLEDNGFLSNLKPIEILEKYYNDMLLCIENYNNFDVLGKFDYIDKYFLDSSKVPRYDEYFEIISEILKLLILNGKGIELNTGGILSGHKYFHPKIQILNLYKDLGGEIVTIGSNAHKAENVGYGYRAAEKMLKDLGFKYIHLFKDRKKFPINLR